jgi:hypothetical protein
MTVSRTRSSTVFLVLLAGTAFTACAGEEATEPSLAPTGTAAPAPSPGPSDIPIDETTLLAFDAVATAPDGAELALSARVHTSLPASDPDVSDERELLLSQCGPDFVTSDALTDDSWGIVRVDVVAQQLGDAPWPADSLVSVVTAPRGEPGAAAVAVSGDPLVIADDPAGELGPCLVAPFVEGKGEASVVLGIRYDFASPDAKGVLWNGYRFGFSSVLFGEMSDVVLSECDIERTPVATELAAPEIGYEALTSAAECTAGFPPAS